LLYLLGIYVKREKLESINEEEYSENYLNLDDESDDLRNDIIDLILFIFSS